MHRPQGLPYCKPRARLYGLPNPHQKWQMPRRRKSQERQFLLTTVRNLHPCSAWHRLHLYPGLSAHPGLHNGRAFQLRQEV